MSGSARCSAEPRVYPARLPAANGAGMNTDTIFALASGRPPAAIAIIRVSGLRAHSAAESLSGSLPPKRLAKLRVLIDPKSGEQLDSAIVVRFDAPASATGEDIVEFHCHGGRAVVDVVLATLGKIEGLRIAEPGEFTRRAFANGRIDLTEAEGLADLLEAQTEGQRKAALAIAGGGLRRLIDRWQERTLGLSAAAERAIDYDDEDEALDPALLVECDVMASEIELWLQRPRAELLRDGILVVIAGPPNAGKSSLINAIVGEERSIVTDTPGTTRDHIEVPLAIAGVPFRLTDTAGLREAADPVEAIGVARAGRLIEAADILVWLGEPDEAPGHPRTVLVHAKADLGTRPSFLDVIPTSALTGAGIPAMLDRVSALALDFLPGEGELALNRRQADLLAKASTALRAASNSRDYPLLAEDLRLARSAFDRLTGRAGVFEMLDALFSRFCLGK
jgi:tRNA modification GTPase